MYDHLLSFSHLYIFVYVLFRCSYFLYNVFSNVCLLVYLVICIHILAYVILSEPVHVMIVRAAFLAAAICG